MKRSNKSYTLHARTSGSGGPVVLLHGMAGSFKYWSKLVPLLEKRHKVIAVDLLGFGRSPMPRGAEYNIPQHIESIRATLESHNIKGKVTLVGHSMGAILALYYAAWYPDEVKKLVLAGVPLFYEEGHFKAHILESRIMPHYLMYGPIAWSICHTVCRTRPLGRFIAGRTLRKVPKEVAEDAVYHTWISYRRSLRNIAERPHNAKELGIIKCPVIILAGENDRAISKANLAKLKEHNDMIKVVEVEGDHHLPLKNPRAIAEQV